MSSLFTFNNNKIIYINENNVYVYVIDDQIYLNLIKIACEDINNIIFNDKDNKYYDDKKIKFKINLNDKIIELEYKFQYQIKDELFTKGEHEFKKVLVPLNKLPFDFTDKFYISSDYGVFNICEKKINICITNNTEVNITIDGFRKYTLLKKGEFTTGIYSKKIYKFKAIHNGDSIIFIYPVIQTELK